ncbi:class I SAM-dependent methyltransferase [Fulvivirga sp. M361]|uniref:class I SAM-dependent methyltransferase n=1 Tax=Fulvivirga sp. M361 TaxID=2594266 RepID=UPI0016258D2F|nr:class I SAM-dependent methyltransferase [Fulvivirga sp. M361]
MVPAKKSLGYYIALLLTLASPCVTILSAQNIYPPDTWEKRDTWQNVPEIMKFMGIKKGDVIADIGSHQGYMTLKFSKETGPAGKVYAVDVNHSHLKVLDKLLRESEITNVETIRGEYDDPKLPENSLDHAFIMDTYHEMDDYLKILKHIKQALKPGGKLVIIEPIGEERRTWNRKSQEGKHEIAIRYVLDDLEKAGYRIIQQRDPFIERGQHKKDALWALVAIPYPLSTQ